MINKLTRNKQLESDAKNVQIGLKECINEGMFIDAKITSSTLRKDNSYISVEVLLREHGEIITKQLAFSVTNNTIYSVLPLVGLCNE